jgi:hypothetical protein
MPAKSSAAIALLLAFVDSLTGRPGRPAGAGIVPCKRLGTVILAGTLLLTRLIVVSARDARREATSPPQAGATMTL